nr:PREDICTED: receptor-type tyrosine-protein phosphatase C-like isoform X2 [Tribolium castaneum]|eukprot:XP_008195741.2 PREDICTED: receptor-type tyrosine-protein phosphatase C-like isoform X2 [Tribolium castaneum]
MITRLRLFYKIIKHESTYFKMFLMHLHVCVWCLLIKIFVKGEILTLINRQNVTCVTSGDDVNSTIYLHPATNVPLEDVTPFKSLEHQKSDLKKWIPKKIITDQRWQDFKIEENKLEIVPLENVSFSFSGRENFTVHINNKYVGKTSNKICENWCHFLLHIYSNNTVQIKDDQNNIIFLTNYVKGSKNITLTAHSPSFWKLHKFDYLKLSNEQKPITVQHTGTLRLSMFVYLDKNSNLKLYLISNNKTIERNIDGRMKPKEWQKIEMTIESVNATTLHMKPTKFENIGNKSLWAVDRINFYTSSRGIFRATNISSTSNQVYVCKRLNDSHTTNIKHVLKLNGCHNAKFGSSCEISCSDVLGKEFKNCEEHKMCTSKDNCRCFDGYTGEYCDELLKNTLSITETKSNSISLSWTPPKIRKKYKYTLKYYKWRRKFCEERALGKETVVDIRNIAEYKVQNLEPFTEYLIELYNSNQRPVIANIKGTTKPDKQITEKELPTKFQFSKDLLTLQFEDCQYFNGPLSYDFSFQCVSTWCKKDQKIHKQLNMTSHVKTLTYNTTRFLPFTDYKLAVKASRFDSHIEKEYNTERTGPKAPHQVKDLKIVCRNSATAWISWKPPYPPTGNISHYVITTDNKRNDFNSSDTQATIKNLRTDTQYTITITAKNLNVEDTGEPKSMTIPKFTDLEKPQNLSFDLLSRNKLRLTWSHPIIKDFHISVLGKHSQNFSLISKKCKKMYHHELDDEDNRVINIWGLEASSVNKSHINVTTKNAHFSSQPFLTICLETKCSLWVPKPTDAGEESNYTILVENKHNESDKRTLSSLELIDDYFHVELGDEPDQVVSLENETYRMSLVINKSVYPFIEKKYQTASLAGLVALCTVSFVTVIFLCYLFYAYKNAVYPFELRKNSEGNKDDEWIIMEFSERYQRNSIKRVRPKCDSPPKAEELEVLAQTSTTTLKIDHFEDYLMHSLGEDPKDNDLTKQYQAIPNPTKPRTVGLLKRNVAKNRYKNIIAFDETRVKLKDYDGYDYINASYVDGYKVPRAFIATQAPMESTIGDFWWMVWQENVKNIIMLTELVENNVEKCAQYWPELKSHVRYGKILIRNTYQKIHADFIQRKLSVRCNNENRTIQHLQFVTWPDHQVPLYPQNFTKFVRTMVAMPLNKSRIVVHCNAGCGRTGTLILCDTVLRMAAKETKLDFVKTLTNMRQQRTNLVSNVDQYIFAHFIVLECLFEKNFSIRIDDSFQDEVMKVLRKTTVKPLMEHLDKVMMQFKKREVKLSGSITDEDKTKNRFSDILPGNAKVFLQTSSRHTSSYINAVFVDCYRCPKKFIVTQQPLPNTLDDFWRMIKYREINTIVSLNEIDGSDPRCPKFWALDTDSTSLEILEENNNKTYSTTKLKIMDKRDTSVDKIINVLELKNWKRETPQPKNVKDLIMVWREMFSNSWKGTSQIVVTCYDGATASGLFVALAFLLEKINYEQECDVFSAIRAVRQSREQFVQEWGQVEFLYKAAKLYVEEFDNYHNFN